MPLTLADLAVAVVVVLSAASALELVRAERRAAQTERNFPGAGR